MTSKSRLSAEELNLQEMIADMKKDPDAAAYIQSTCFNDIDFALSISRQIDSF